MITSAENEAKHGSDFIVIDVSAYSALAKFLLHLLSPLTLEDHSHAKAGIVREETYYGTKLQNGCSFLSDEVCFRSCVQICQILWLLDRSMSFYGL